MIPNITRGDRADDLVFYLVGPGRANEHENPHLVDGSPSIMAWYADQTLDRRAARGIVDELNEPHRAYPDVKVPTGVVWHCSLSLATSEGAIGDEKWAAISADFMKTMGLDDPESGKAPVRYAVVHHGPSKRGNDHVHIAATLIREDGTKANPYRDYKRAQAACRELEQRYGLLVIEGRAIGLGERGIKPGEREIAARAGSPETTRERLERIVRATAATSASEAEFVAGVQGAGLWCRPWFADGGQSVVTGWKVAVAPPRGEAPRWFGGKSLARDLSLPRLREAHGWATDDSAGGVVAAEAAVEAWRSAWRHPGGPPTRGGARQVEVDPALVERYAGEVAGLREQLRSAPAGSVGTWSVVAHQLAGAFSAWSLAAEGDTPGPLAATAAAIARSAQVPRGFDDPATREAWAPSIRGVSMVLASASRGGRGPVALAVLLRQLSNTAHALYLAHEAQGRASEAQRIASVVLTDLEQVRQALPSPELRGAADVRAAVARQAVGAGRPRDPRSPVPAARLRASRAGTEQQAGGVER